MAKNLNEGIDLLVNEGLAGMPVADKLWQSLISEVESEIGPTDTLATLTVVTAGIGVTSLVCASRVIDFAGPRTFPEITGIAGALLITTDNPVTPGAKAISVENINGGTTLDLSVSGPYTADESSCKVAHQGEA